ncbi:hypothetical protein PV10_07402 [Exophiala mesophila]|uniref:Choline transport protein n=1 Tax=Exophiala mesophila TaxID=212818 RepID=A0A0D1Z5I0_EXOME|nr:uncharacterized protein PV10_07402 [Exophiala mesophila]KIV90057.1 hypothetical protein PV10_07402 [Exophiala mesophila]
MDSELGKKPLTPEEVISVQTTRDNGLLEVPSLAALGLEESHVKRNFNMLSILALGFNICASWVGIAASIAFAIAAGGTVSLLYGLLVVVFFNMCIALSLAELASVYPTAGGQYHFVSILSPKAYARAFSYTCGFTGVAAWIAISSAVTIAVSHGIVTIVLRWHPDFSPTHWQEFLLYQAINVYSFLHNLFLSKRNPLLYDFGFALSLSAFIVITICCPAVAKEHASSSDVWTSFVNSAASWPDGVSFFIGLTTPQFMLLGLDGALHMAEECLEPEKVVPKALIATVGVGGVTAFLFAISMSYCLTDLELVLNSPTGFPIYALWEQATGSVAAIIVFMTCLTILGLITLHAINQTSSRLTWSFARDNGLIFPTFLSRMNTRWQVPVYSLLLDHVCIGLIGLLYLASSTAFNSFINTAEITTLLSVGCPSILVLWRKRSTEFLPENRSFRLPNWLGYFVNIAGLIYVALMTVFFCLPTELPVTGANMNYCSVVLAVIFLVGVGNWFFHARKNYEGPRLDFRRPVED